MKNTLMKKIFVTTLMAVLTLSTQAEVIDKIEKSFNVDESSQFSLENINGAVEIIGWDQQVIQVKATIKADNQDDRDRISIDMQQNSRGVIVETRYKKESSWGFNNNQSGNVTYEVMVPMDVNLSSIELVNGSLIIENVHGEVNVELVNGSVKAMGLMSNSDIASVNGSIKVQYESKASDIKQIKIQTVNGSIKLVLPENISASVDAETMHGSIKNDFGLSNDEESFMGKSLQGDIGSGDARVSLESVNGSIKILSN
ncbi:MAG: DUF4097 family beta strand repeat-containing protein [Colwellia sp.]|nr:DUF4097 family beta strand repeat-containing protein [Colwellia sp.]